MPNRPRDQLREEPASSNGACKRYCFTLNNPSEHEINALSLVQLGTDINFLVIGKEIAPTTGTPHLQGYLELVRRMRMQQVRTLVPSLSRAAMLVARGSRIQNHRYCVKDGSVLVEIGEVPKYATRSDLDEIKKYVDEGADELEIAEQHFPTWARNYRAIKVYMGLKKRNTAHFIQKEVRVYWGATGTGKTRKVWEEEPEGLWTWSGGNWFDGYHGQEAVLFDDFDVGSGIGFRFFLRILDGYPIEVPVKGSFVPWTPTRVYITSNVSYESWFPLEPDVTPLRRRLTEIIHFNSL